MNVLVLGSGAREHALAWKLRQSPGCRQVFLHPGNAGTIRAGFPALGDLCNLDEIVEGCRTQGIGLVVIGPEQLLYEGYGNRLRKEGFRVVGPDREAARLETSKIFAKEFMVRAGIQTAPFEIFSSPEALLSYTRFPTVFKLDGLAAGKGVVVATQKHEAEDFARRIWQEKEFGPGPHRVLRENFIRGRELSYIGLCDGETFRLLSSATDFKRVGDGDTGANTGGMGVLSPSPLLTPALETGIERNIVARVLTQMKREAFAFRGILYIGLMITAEKEPWVLEFNTRFGDPETQAVLLRLKSDLLEMMVHTADQQISKLPPLQWSTETSVYVVGAASGYPGRIRTGDRIEGLDAADSDVQVFFSGVSSDQSQLVTQGGRVLGVGATGSSLEDARKKVYANIRKIRWNGMHYRSDIGIIGGT